jgi:hypothetical protein
VEEEEDLQDVDLLVDQGAEEEVHRLERQVILLQLVLHKVIQVEMLEVFQVMVAEVEVEQEQLEQLELHQDQLELVELEYLIVFQDQEYLTLVAVEVELPIHLLQVQQEEEHLLVELEELEM